MQTVNQLLDAVKAKHQIPSDYKLAFFLEVAPGSVKNWRHERSLPDSKTVAKLARELGLDADVLMLQVEAQRAATDHTKAAWLRIAKRLQAGAVHVALLVAVGLVSFTSTPSAHATVTSTDAARGVSLYIMLSHLRKSLRAMRRALADTLGPFLGSLRDVQSADTDAAYLNPAR